MAETSATKRKLQRPPERRRAAITLIQAGETQAEVARLLGVSREAVRKWWDKFEAGGAAAIARSTAPRGPQISLTDEQVISAWNRVSEKDQPTIAAVHHAVGGDKRASISAVRRRLIKLGLWERGAGD